jgi:hypothetical protein
MNGSAGGHPDINYIIFKFIIKVNEKGKRSGELKTAFRGRFNKIKNSRRLRPCG